MKGEAPAVLAVAALLLPLPRAARAQVDPSVGLGVGTVRYAGGASFSSAALSPAFHAAFPGFAADAAGSVASLPGAVWATQGRADLWGASGPLVSHLRVGAEAIAAGTTRSDSGWTSALHGVAEVLWSEPRWGVGLGAGPSAGWIANAGGVTALHTRARLWWRPGEDGEGAEWALALEPTSFLGAWFTDATASVTLARGAATLSLAASARLSGAYGSKGAGSAFLQLFLAPSVALELGGGSYLPDPYQGLPRAGFLTLGLRLHAAALGRHPRAAARVPLVPQSDGDSLVVRFRMDSARSVEIAGDWNAWRPVALRPLGANLWEGKLALAPGLYHFNLRVDGSDWVVPNGVATVPDGLGGIVGLLVVR